MLQAALHPAPTTKNMSIQKPLNNDLLMVSISKFYMSKETIQKMLPIVLGTSRISLRLVDWFVTNYAKHHNVILINEVDDHSVHFNVYASYRAQLKAYSKQQFDPFRRRERIDFYYDQDEFVETTIGQLNFFRWMLQNGLVDYIDSHFDVIESDMIRSQRINSEDSMTESKDDALFNNDSQQQQQQQQQQKQQKGSDGHGGYGGYVSYGGHYISKSAPISCAPIHKTTPPRTVLFN